MEEVRQLSFNWNGISFFDTCIGNGISLNILVAWTLSEVQSSPAIAVFLGRAAIELFWWRVLGPRLMKSEADDVCVGRSSETPWACNGVVSSVRGLRFHYLCKGFFVLLVWLFDGSWSSALAAKLYTTHSVILQVQQHRALCVGHCFDMYSEWRFCYAYTVGSVLKVGERKSICEWKHRGSWWNF